MWSDSGDGGLMSIICLVTTAVPQVNVILFFLTVKLFIWSFHCYIVKLKKRPAILLGPNTA